MRNLAIALLIIAAAACSFIGCKSNACDEIKVGVTLPLSGALVSYGKDVLEGVKLRVEQINAAGGLGGRKLVLKIEDNKGDPTDTRNAIKKLTEVDDVVAIIGPITSTSALAAKIDADKAKTPLITPTATNDRVTQNTEWVFRTIFTDSFQGQKMAQYVFASAGIRKAAVLIDSNSDYSKGLAASFAGEFRARGGAITASENYQQKDTDFGTQMDKIIKSGAQIIFVPGYPPEVPQIIKQAKVSGFPGLLCGADGWDNSAVIDNAGDKIVNCFFSAAFYADDDSTAPAAASPAAPAGTQPAATASAPASGAAGPAAPVDRSKVKQFVKAIGASSNKLPGSFEALGYDSVVLLEEAIRKAGTERAAIGRALHELRDVEGVTGRITIGPNGDAIRPLFIKKVVQEGNGYVAKHMLTVNP